MKTSAYYDKDNKNFFDIEKEFFIIDSEHLEDVQTRFYGFSVQSTGIFENENLTEAAVLGLDGCGAYIYIESRGKEILIQQDFNGAYGIYLYENAGRFILSNSFFRLLDYIKYQVTLSLDFNYANHILLNDLTSHAYAETPVNEVKLLGKDVIITIDIDKKKLSYQKINYGEATIALDSEEGIRILDSWFDKWTTVFRNIQANTNQISVDLSGGFDSRITFLLLLKSGLDLNEITVNSAEDKLHTHGEDYEIALQIADYYGFKLNNRKNVDNKSIHYSLQDIINISFYVKMAFHKEMYFKHRRFAEKRFRVPGAGGESLRDHWNVTPQEFIEQMSDRSKRYSGRLAKEMTDATRNIFKTAYQAVSEKYGIKDPNSTEYPTYIYRETRNRSHFGKAHVEDYFANMCTLAPLIDPQLSKLRLCTSYCQDNNLLMAVIYMRYCPELLNFKFEGKRAIDGKTIQAAKEISDKFPQEEVDKATGTFSVITEDKFVLDIIGNNEDNQAIPWGIPDKYLKEVFDSCSFRKLFATYFDEELYVFADNWEKQNSYFQMRYCYAIIGLVRVIEDIELSNQLQHSSVVQSMDRFIGHNFYEPDDRLALIEKLKNYLTARIDVSSADFELQYISDNRGLVATPPWFQKNGKGYVIESFKGELNLVFKINTDSQLDIGLKSKDIRDKNGNRIPYWIDYRMFSYNGIQVLPESKAAWHDKPINMSRKVKEGEVVYLHVEWAPCKADDPNHTLIQTERKLKDTEYKWQMVENKLKETEHERQIIEDKLKDTEHKRQIAENKNKATGQKLRTSLSREASLKQSVSFRLGRAITWLPRKIRDYMN